MTAPVSDISADPTQHPAMRRFAAAVRALYGERVERVVLFGSRARGDAREDSDWDVAVFLHGTLDWWAEAQKLADIALEILTESDVDISPLGFAAGAYDERTLAHPADARASPRGSRPVTPEAAHALGSARKSLEKAEQILARTDLADVAAREAHLAALDAARAVVFDFTGKVAKTHMGAHAEISRLARSDPRIDPQFAPFLKAGPDVKLHADYGEGRPIVRTAEQARTFLSTAGRLVAHAEALLAQP